MRVPALAMTNPLLGRAQRGGHDFIQRRDEDSSIFVRIDSIRIAHDGDEFQFRPYVRIKGQLESITPSYRLPGAVSTIPFTEENGLSVDVRYDFTKDQMIALIEKGFFKEGFGFVDGVRGETLELNAPVEYQISREYDENGLDVPVVFFDIPDRTNLRVDEYTSGYDFVEYMALPDREIEKFMENEAEAEFGVSRDLFAELHAQFENEVNPEAVYDVGTEIEQTDEFERAREAVKAHEAEAAPQPEAELSEGDRLFVDGVSSTLEESIPTADDVQIDEQSESVYGAAMREYERSVEQGTEFDMGSLDLRPLRGQHGPSQSNDENAWLFENDGVEQGSADQPTQEVEQDEQVEQSEPSAVAFDVDNIGHTEDDRNLDAGKKAERDASRARMAAMMAEHARQAEIAAAAHELGLDEKDIPTPGS